MVGYEFEAISRYSLYLLLFTSEKKQKDAAAVWANLLNERVLVLISISLLLSVSVRFRVFLVGRFLVKIKACEKN